MGKRSKKTFLLAATFLMIAFLAITFTSCIRVGLVGSGNVVSEEREVSGFDEVSVSTGINLYIEQTGEESLTVEAEDNILQKIETRVKNGRLEIRIEPMTFGGVRSREPINCYVTVNEIDAIDVSSGATVETGLLDTDDLSIDLSSGSEGYLEVSVKSLEVDISSGSGMEVSGDADKQTVDISSGSDYDAIDLISKEAVIDASSGSSAKINVSESLEVDISSGSSVKYQGSPKVNTDISSGASLESISD